MTPAGKIAVSPPPAVIVAGGLGRRMAGLDKPFVPVGGRTMLARTVDRLAPQVGSLAINANGDPRRFSAFGLPVIPDSMPGHAGPLAGLFAGMRWASEQAPDARCLASAPADTPFFPADLIARLAAARPDDVETIALAASNGVIHPLFGLWPVALAESVSKFLRSGSARVLRFVEGHRWTTVTFDNVPLPEGGDFDPFLNVNTPRDVVAAEAIASALGGGRA